MALNVFPNDAADELREYAEKASWYCAEVRFGKTPPRLKLRNILILSTRN